MPRLRLALGALLLAALPGCFTTLNWNGVAMPGLGPGERDGGEVVLAVVLTPLTLALDLVTSPIQISVLVWEWLHEDAPAEQQVGEPDA